MERLYGLAEMMFAVEVHKIANERREAVVKTVQREAPYGDTGEALAAFNTESPLSVFVEGVYLELHAIAKQVKALRDAENAAGIEGWIKAPS